MIRSQRLGVIARHDVGNRVGPRDIERVRARSRARASAPACPDAPASARAGRLTCGSAGREADSSVMSRGYDSLVDRTIGCTGPVAGTSSWSGRLVAVAIEDHPKTVQGQPGLVSSNAWCSGRARALASEPVITTGRLRHPRDRVRPSMRATTPSTWLANPKTDPACSASTVFLAITDRGVISST